MSAYACLAGIDAGDDHPVRIVGVLNVSPESFYPGSVVTDSEELAERARTMAADGADLIDIGAMSTAPYLQTHVSEAEERQRMEWAVGIVARTVSVPVSADTRRASVAAAALAAGARVINDTTGLRGDPLMADVAAQAEGLIVMACEEGTMGEAPLPAVERLLRDSLGHAERAGIPAERIVVDPGIGFFRHTRVSWLEFDLEILRNLSTLRLLCRPILIGLSRKSFIGKLIGRGDEADRLAGSLGAAAIGIANGASMVRTHDVLPTRDAARVAERLRSRQR